MKLVLLNTCGSEASLALADTASSEPARLVTIPGRSASERLVLSLRQAMADAGWQRTDPEVIAVVTGPGSFTGVRVGLSAAKGLSEALGLPIVAISRLELLATLIARESRSVCALLDAGRGDFYCGSYRMGQPFVESLLSMDESIAAALTADAVVICEDTVERAMSGRLGSTRVPEPSAADALPLALQCVQQGGFADPETLDANYLRRTDAEIFLSSPRQKTN